MELEHRPSGPPVSFVGSVLTVAVGIVAVFFVVKTLAFLAGVVYTVLKVAVVVGLVGLAVRFFAWRKRD